MECPKCGVELVKRRNGITHGTFYGCINYPECLYTASEGDLYELTKAELLGRWFYNEHFNTALLIKLLNKERDGIITKEETNLLENYPGKEYFLTEEEKIARRKAVARIHARPDKPSRYNTQNGEKPEPALTPEQIELLVGEALKMETIK